MQKDVQLYQSQIEAGKASYKKMQAELQKELQSVFQENTRLISLLEGKAPKGTVSSGGFSPPALPLPHYGEGIGKTISCFLKHLELLSI